MADDKISFPKMSEIETPKGAEGWQEMYASFHIPGEMKEEEDNKLWFRDNIHKPRPVYPFDAYDPESWGRCQGETSSYIFVQPTSLGCDQRIVNGYLYVSPQVIEDPKVIAERIKKFRERAKFYYENYSRLIELRRTRIFEMNRTLENMDFSWPSDEESERYVYEVTSKQKLSPSLRIIFNYNRLIELIYEAWCYHFELLFHGYSAYMTFYDFCREHFPDISDVEVSSMTAGVAVDMYKPQEYLIELAELTTKLKLEDIFFKFKGLTSEKVEELFTALRGSEGGKAWIKRLDEIKDPWFNVATGRGYNWTEYTWLDDLSLPINIITEYIGRIREGKRVERPMAAVEERRDRLLEVYRSLLESDEDRKMFNNLLELCRISQVWNEGHQFYLDGWFHQAMYHAVRRLGKTIKESGLIDDGNDIFYLNRHEIGQLAYEMMFNYGMGYPVSKGDRWRAKIEKRKKIMEVLEAWEGPPALGPAPEKVTDMYTRMNWGITAEVLRMWHDSMTGVKGAKGNVIEGFAGSPGKVVGKARVITDVTKLSELEEGEILVAPSTEPSWSYAFVKLAGTVTDIGGVMSHAAIVCREYGLPAVTGVGYGTSLIKTGQTIEVDGDEGIVRILE